MPSTVTSVIEVAVRRDFASATALLRATNLPITGVADQFPAAYVVVRRRDALLALAGLEIYGAAGLLRSLAVHPDAQGRGLGRALVANRLAEARARGLTGVYLLTTTAADYFRGLGFAPADRARVPDALRGSPEFACVCPSSATCLVFACG